MVSRNGRSAFLGPPASAGYRYSAVSTTNFHIALQNGFFTWYDIEAMRRDPRIQFGLRILSAPIHTARWTVEADHPAISEYVDRTMKFFWEHDLSKALQFFAWGVCGGELNWEEADDTGLIEYDGLNDINFHDIRPLRLRGGLAGVMIKRTRRGTRKISPPRSFWLVNEPEFGSLYGRPRLAGAWEPWMEKRGKHGAIDIRRLWYIKNVFRGGVLYHPMGTIETDDGRVISCQDFGRELLEKMETGGTLTLPNSRDEQGNFLWHFEPAEINGDGEQLLEYPKQLDLEILEGMGIPTEVVVAGDSGGGWSGRSVPFLVFLKSEDQIVNTIIHGVDEQIVSHGVKVNFGPGAKYKINPISLIPKPEELMVPERVAAADQEGKKPGQPTGGNPQKIMGKGGATGNPVQLGDDLTDRLITRAAGGIELSKEVRRKIRKAVAKKFPKRK